MIRRGRRVLRRSTLTSGGSGVTRSQRVGQAAPGRPPGEWSAPCTQSLITSSRSLTRTRSASWTPPAGTWTGCRTSSTTGQMWSSTDTTSLRRTLTNTRRHLGRSSGHSRWADSKLICSSSEQVGDIFSNTTLYLTACPDHLTSS